MSRINTIWKPSASYADRQIKFRELRNIDGWQFKLYTITYSGDKPIEWPLYEQAIKLAADTLPQPAVTDKRPGVGFIICHQGRAVHYLVFYWWDNENECVTHVFIRAFGDNKKWQSTNGTGSFCVWDLEIIWFERQAYVKRVLSIPDNPDIEGYLSERMNKTVNS